MIYLLLGDEAEARTYCHEAGMPRASARFVAGALTFDHAKLRPGDRIIREGSWFDRVDLRDVEHAIGAALGREGLYVSRRGIVVRRP